MQQEETGRADTTADAKGTFAQDQGSKSEEEEVKRV